MKQIFKSLPITVKFDIIITLALFIGCLAVYGVTYALVHGIIIDDIKERAVNINRQVQDTLDVNTFTQLNGTTDEQQPLYEKNQQYLNKVRELVNAQFLYTAKLNADGQLIYVIDGLAADHPDFRPIGAFIEPELRDNLMRCLSGETVTPQKPINTDWGYMYVTYCPVYGVNGAVLGAIGMEFNVDHIMRALQTAALFSLAAAFLLAGAVMLLTAFLLKKVAEPYYKKLAYNDYLTGLPNRLAYEHRFRDYETRGKPLEAVTLIIFDLNELKHINDNFGHSAGDVVIRQSARIIDQAFKKQGGAYRIGGDELAVFIEGETPEIVQAMLDALSAEKQYVYKHFYFNVAYGAATFDPAVDKNLHDVFDRADQKMYELKKVYHQDHPRGA